MASFTYERVKEFTGKVQYRTDGASAVSAAGRSVKRGEVIEIKNAAIAIAMVNSGNFAHVAPDTPFGVPDETALTEPLQPEGVGLDDAPALQRVTEE